MEESLRFQTEALPWLDDVARFARWLTKDEVNAADLVQETFLKAFRNWRTYQQGAGCKPWLLAICRNTFLRQHSREQRIVAVEDAELEALAAAAVHETAQQRGLEDMFSLVDVGEAVERALKKLPVSFREAVILIDLNDIS